MKQQINFGSHLNKQMLYFLVVAIFTLLLSGNVFAMQNVSGVISISAKKLFITINARTYPLQSNDQETFDQMRKFDSGDLVSGSGEFIAEGTRFNLVSIDFVGLNKLLGWWRIGSNYYMNFRDFANVSYISTSSTATKTNNFKYAVAPDEEMSVKTWRLFLTDSSSVHIGTLLLKENQATIQLFDADTGLPSQVIDLLKVKK